MINNKYIKLIVVYACIVFFIVIMLYVLDDWNKVKKHLEECQQECYPAKVVERFSIRGCFCNPIETEEANE